MAAAAILAVGGPRGPDGWGIPMDPSLEGEQWICDGRDERDANAHAECGGEAVWEHGA